LLRPSVVFALGALQWSPRIDDHKENPGVLALDRSLAMGGQDIAGEPDQVVAVMGDIGDDSACLGDTVC